MAGSESFFAGWLIDGSGKPPEKNILMTVADGEIRSLRACGASPGKSERDLAGCTILPGLIDGHVHLSMSGTQDPGIRKRQLTNGYDKVQAKITARLKKSLQNGVVAVRDGGDRYGHALAYRRTDLNSRVTPIRVLAAGRAWRREGRYGKLIGRAPERGSTLAQGLEASLEKGDHIKIVNSGLNSLVHFGRQTAPQFSLEEMRAAVSLAKRMGLKTMVHANGTIPVDIAVRAGCDSIEHGFFMGKDNLMLMADWQTVWVPTAFTMKAYIEYMKNGDALQVSDSNPGEPAADGLVDPVDGARKNLDHQLEQIALARRLGVLISAGTDAGSPGVHHGNSLRSEIELLTVAGLSGHEALQSATSTNARLLGIDRGGLLAPGMPATFIVVKGGPDEIPQSLDPIECLYLDGKRWVG